MTFSRREQLRGEYQGIAPALVLSVLLGVSILLAFLLAKSSALLVIGILLGLLLLAASFFHPEFGVAVLIMAMLFSPEIGAGTAGAGSSVETSRSIVVRLDDILLIILASSWFARTAVFKDLGLILKNPLNQAIGLYTVSCVISTVIGFMNGNVRFTTGLFFVLRYIEYFVVFFVSINFIDSRRTIVRFSTIAFVTAGLIALYGIYQIPSGVRVSAPFEGETGEPNTMGGYLLLMMCMAAGQLLVARRKREFLGWSAYIALLAVPLLFTGSRASWLGIPAAILALIFFSFRKKQIAVFVVLFLAVSPYLTPRPVMERILFTFQQEKQTRARQIEVGGLRLDTSTSARIQSWEVALEGWLEKPLLGWGVTGFIFVDAQYVRALVETGIVGLAIFLWLMWGYFRSGRASLRAAPDRFQLGIGIGYLAGLFGLVSHGIGSNTFIILRIMEPWMLFTAIVVRIPVIQAERDARWRGKEDTEAPLTDGDGAASSGRFQRRLTAYESFLERERIEVARRAEEDEREGAQVVHRPGGVVASPLMPAAKRRDDPPSAPGRPEAGPERRQGRAAPIPRGKSSDPRRRPPGRSGRGGSRA